jgi:mono/diheme cytochrome c family protein
MIKKTSLFLVCLWGVMMLVGCRGNRSETTPFHLNPNFDWQSKYKAQSLSMTPPEGTVVWGADSTNAEDPNRAQYAKLDSEFYRGKTASGQWVARIPVPVTETLMQRGQERFDIYCAVCHDKAGTGQGMVVKHGFVPPPNLSDDRLLAYSDGQIFDVISHGIRNMPGYAKQIPEKDRWAIVAYVRALQKTRTASLNDVPSNLVNQIK